jgi:hypothetical protein
VQTGQLDGAAATRQPDVVGHLGHRADLRELALVLGNEQDPLLARHVDRERDAHVGEDDEVFHGDQQQVAHVVPFLFLLTKREQV